MKTYVQRIEVWNIRGTEHAAFDLAPESNIFEGGYERGKTTMLFALMAALQTRANRLDPEAADLVRHNQESARILITLSDGTEIDRVLKPGNASDSVTVRQNKNLLARPAEFLSSLGYTCQIDPLRFTQMNGTEQVSTICGLLGEEQTLGQIQEEIREAYNDRRQISKEIEEAQRGFDTLTSDIRTLKECIGGLGELPQTDAIHAELRKAGKHNEDIALAKAARLQAEEAVLRLAHDTAETEKALAEVQNSKDATLQLAKDKYDQEVNLINEQHEKLRADLTKQLEDNKKESAEAKKITRAPEQEPIDVDQLLTTLSLATERDNYEKDLKMTEATAHDAKLTVKRKTNRFKLIEDNLRDLREKPGSIAKKLDIPGLRIEAKDGRSGTVHFEIHLPDSTGTVIPLLDHSDSGQLMAAIRIATSRPGTLSAIAVDGLEKCSPTRLSEVLAACKDRGVQLIGTRVTKGNLSLRKL